MGQGVEPQDGSKDVPYPSFSLGSQGMYFTLLEVEPEPFQIELAVKQLDVENWLSTCSNDKA